MRTGFSWGEMVRKTIYRRGFSLRTAGIEVATRSYVMKKNYRNTQEVLRASFGLIEHYEVADVHEDNIAGRPNRTFLSGMVRNRSSSSAAPSPIR